jgi:hypothetical protein
VREKSLLRFFLIMSRTTETSDLGQTHDYNVTKDRNWTKEKAAATKSTYPVIASGSEISGTLKGKWRGTDQDQHDMFSLGRIQELRVSSSPQNDLLLLCSLFVNALAELFLLVYDGLHSDASLYLEITLILLSYALVDGGTAGLLWGYVVVGIGFLLVYSSLAEVAAMAPTAGGQYHCKFPCSCTAQSSTKSH